jgi:phage portal protein BeeE
MNPFQRLANRFVNWWRGAPQDSGGVMTLNSRSFMESLGITKKRTTSEVTYFTCLKMLSETLAKMPIKYYRKTENGIIEAEQTDTSKLLTKRPNPIMTPTVFWNAVESHSLHGSVYKNEL